MGRKRVTLDARSMEDALAGAAAASRSFLLNDDDGWF